MAAIKTLCLTSLFLVLSRISALQTGNASKTACESSNVTIDFIFNIGNDNFADRSWYKNSVIPANRIARVISAGSLTVESQYSGRTALNGSGGIILYNVTKTDSGSYLFIIVTDITSEFGTATTTVNVYVNPNASCIPIIENNSAGNFTCKISDACPGKDSIQAIWDGGSVGVFTCPSTTENTKYKCCAKGDPVTYCNSGGLCTEIECKGSGKQCQPPQSQHELALGLCFGLGIPIVITFVVVIFIYKGHNEYVFGLAHGVGIGVTFQVGWILIAILISTGTISCKLEFGLALGLSLGIACVITFIIAVIFIFKGSPKKFKIGKGILTGLLFTSVIGIIVVYLLYDKLIPEETCIPKRVEIVTGILIGLLFTTVIGIIVVVVYFMYHKCKRKLTSINHEDNPPKQDGTKHEHNTPKSDVTRDKTKNSGHPTSHLGKNNKVDPNTNSKQANDRQQPMPPVNTAFEDTPTFRPLPQRPQNGEIKDQNLRGRSATIDDTPGLANETSRNNILPPLTLQPKMKRKKNKKKDQRNEKTPEDENSETILMVD